MSASPPNARTLVFLVPGVLFAGVGIALDGAWRRCAPAIPARLWRVEGPEAWRHVSRFKSQRAGEGAPMLSSGVRLETAEAEPDARFEAVAAEVSLEPGSAVDLFVRRRGESFLALRSSAREGTPSGWRLYEDGRLVAEVPWRPVRGGAGVRVEIESDGRGFRAVLDGERLPPPPAPPAGGSAGIEVGFHDRVRLLRFESVFRGPDGRLVERERAFGSLGPPRLVRIFALAAGTAVLWAGGLVLASRLGVPLTGRRRAADLLVHAILLLPLDRAGLSLAATLAFLAALLGISRGLLLVVGRPVAGLGFVPRTRLAFLLASGIALAPLPFLRVSRGDAASFAREAETSLDASGSIEAPGAFLDVEARFEIRASADAVVDFAFRSGDVAWSVVGWSALRLSPSAPAGFWTSSEAEPSVGGPNLPPAEWTPVRIEVRGEEAVAWVGAREAGRGRCARSGPGGVALVRHRGSAVVRRLAVVPREDRSRSFGAAGLAAAALLLEGLLYALLASRATGRSFARESRADLLARTPLLLAAAAALVAPFDDPLWIGAAGVVATLFVRALRALAARPGAAPAAALSLGLLVEGGCAAEWLLRQSPFYGRYLAEPVAREDRVARFVYGNWERGRRWEHYLGRLEWRGRRTPRERTGGRARVLMLGGSSTWADGVPPEEAYATRLEDRLGPGVEVLNGAARGATSLSQRLYLERDLLAFEPDVVVLDARVNDAAIVHPRGLRREWSELERKGSGVDPLRGMRFFQGYRRLVHLLRARLDAQALRANQSPEEFEATLREFAALAATHGFRLVLVPEPVDAGGGAVDWLERYEEAMERVAREERALFVSPRRAFAEREEDRLYFDSVHPTSLGHALLAEVLEPALRRALGGR